MNMRQREIKIKLVEHFKPKKNLNHNISTMYRTTYLMTKLMGLLQDSCVNTNGLGFFPLSSTHHHTDVQPSHSLKTKTKTKNISHLSSVETMILEWYLLLSLD